MALPKDVGDDLKDLLKMPWSRAKQYHISRESHPEFVKDVERIAGIVGIETPQLMLIPSPIPNAMANPVTNSVFMTEGFLKLIKQDSLHTAPNKKLEMTLAHEMSHIKDGIGMRAAEKLLPWMALPAASVAALYLYDNSRHRHDKKTAIEEAAKHEKNELAKAYAKDHSTSPQILAFQQHLWDAGKTLAVGALGLAGGLHLTRYYGNETEHRADRMAVKVGRDPQALYEMLEEMSKVGAEIKREREKAIKPATGFAGRLSDYIKKELRVIRNEYVSPHPTNEQRLSHMRRYLQELEQGTQHLHV